MKINKITLHNFGIFEDYETKIKPNVNVFSGQNALGKTTLLNAISWCLTGKTINDEDITYDKFINNSHNSEDLSVKIELLPKGTIERRIAGKSHKELLFVDNEELTIKSGDVKIENKMSLLKDLTVSKNIKNLLVNPLYIKNLKTTELTKLITSLLPKIDEPKVDDKRVAELLELYENDIEKVDAALKKEKKLSKDKITQLEYVRNYLVNDFKSNLAGIEETLNLNINHINSEIKKHQNDLLKVSLSIDNFDKYITNKNLKYKELTKSVIGVDFDFVEKTLKDEWKNICVPLTEKGIRYNNASTSEQIIIGIKIVEAIKRIKGYGELPILIDKAESIDKNNLDQLKINSQLIITKVNNSELLTVKGV